jgi:DNA-binding transcriptional MerR regulator
MYNVNMSSDSFVQGTFFGDSLLECGDDLGYGTPIVQKVTGLTRRQLDHWARTGICVPTLKNAKGSGNHRLYSFKDILILQMFKRLLETGITIQKIRKAAEALTKKGITDLTKVTLISDGQTIFQVKSPEEIIDILKSGQGVFAVSLESLWSETEGVLKEFEGRKVEEEVLPENLRLFKERREYARNLSSGR